MPYFFVLLITSLFSQTLNASNLTTNAILIPKILEYSTYFKTDDTCRIGIVYSPDTIKRAILLKRNLQYKSLPERKLIIKLIAYKQFTQRKAVSLDAVYLFTFRAKFISHAQKENVIVFADQKKFLDGGALFYIAPNKNARILLNTKALKKLNHSFSSAFLKIVEPYDA